MYKVEIQYRPPSGKADNVKVYALSEDSCAEAIKGALQRFQEDTVYAHITSVRPVKTSAVLLIRCLPHKKTVKFVDDIDGGGMELRCGNCRETFPYELEDPIDKCPHCNWELVFPENVKW